MNKLIPLTIILGILLVGTVSAGIFDFIFPKPIKIYKPHFNISNDFNNIKLNLDKKPLCDINRFSVSSMILRDKRCSFDRFIGFERISRFTENNDHLFKKNSQGVIRFSNK